MPAAGIGQQKRPNSSPRQCLTAHHTTNTSKVEGIELQSFASFAITTWPLANWLPLPQAFWQPFTRKPLSQPAGDRKWFPRVHWIPKHRCLCYRNKQERSQDGGGIGRGDHFLSYKFIERTIERWANFTKQLLIASRGHQAPRKAAHCLRREVGQNIKDKQRDKRARDGDPSQEGSLNRGSFQSPGNPRTGESGGSFRISEGNLTGRKN